MINDYDERYANRMALLAAQAVLLLWKI